MAPELSVVVSNRQRRHRVSGATLRSFLTRVAAEVPPDGPSELAVRLVSDAAIRRLNRQFRGRDTPTDVLSFPAGEADGPDSIRYLGDIAVSVSTAARQARERGHTLSRELKILALHGYLHLLGFDHERDDGRMMRLQRRVQRALLPPRRKAPRALRSAR